MGEPECLSLWSVHTGPGLRESRISRSPRRGSSRTEPWDGTVGESSRLEPSLGGAEGGVPPSRSAWQKSAGLEGTSGEGQWP